MAVSYYQPPEPPAHDLIVTCIDQDFDKRTCRVDFQDGTTRVYCFHPLQAQVIGTIGRFPHVVRWGDIMHAFPYRPMTIEDALSGNLT